MDRNIKEQIEYQKKNINKFLSEFLDVRFSTNVKIKNLEINLKKYKEIRKNFDKNAVLFLTHGVVTPKSPDNYYFNKEGLRDNDTFLKSLADITNSRYSFFLRWKGNITHEERIKASKNFSMLIKQKLAEISRINGLDPKKIAVNLSGHSFGASIFILTANLLNEEGYNIQLLFTLNCPNNTYKINNKDICHVNLFSYNDWIVQLFGSIYINRNFTNVASFGPARLKFNNAINICIDPLIEMEKFLFFKNNQPEKKIYKNIYHHAARNAKLINKINNFMEYDSFYEAKNNDVINIFKKHWDGEYKINMERENDIDEIKISFFNDRIKIIDNNTNKELLEIYPDSRNEFKKKYHLKYIPFYSSGYLMEEFNITEELFYYKVDCNISILYASDKYNLIIKIEKDENNNFIVKFNKKDNLKGFD